MQVEDQEVAHFLRQYPPFDSLEDDALNELAQQVEISYVRANRMVLQYGEEMTDLYVIRSGAVETHRRNGELFNRLSEGDIFGQMGLLMKRRVRFPARTMEDTLLYCIPADLFDHYCNRFERFAEFFEVDGSDLLRKTLATQADNNDLTTVRVRSIPLRDPVCVNQDTPAHQIATHMDEERVSSVLVLSQQGVIGIITDQDLRSRLLARRLPDTTPAHQIMSHEMAMIEDSEYLFEALLIMLRLNLHHLPVTRKGQPAGVMSMSDILRHESQSSLLMVRGIHWQTNVDELARFTRQLPSVFVRMVNEDANSHMIGSAMSVIGRTIKQRLLELAEEKYGPPPVPYCFLALGSMARDEQLIVTDQDNALILHDDYHPPAHQGYFEKLARFVSDGLNACGYRYCSGNIMASNPEWRLTRQQWRDRFSDWIDHPTPQSLLNSNIFFDLDGVHGETQWADELVDFVTQHATNNTRFLAHMARNALNRTPPLGFFKGFVMEQDGKHLPSINLKRRGTAPLSDLIRIHALAIGSTARNSFERLDDIAASGLLPEGNPRDLSDALEYIALVRIKHQAADIERGDQADNNIEPELLSTFERRNLKEAFQVVDRAQGFLRYRYQAGKPLNLKK
ncbi:MAG: CBS domain-containing protein [Oceanobacter sp.]